MKGEVIRLLSKRSHDEDMCKEFEYNPLIGKLVIHQDKISRTNEIGFVAQELQKVIPEAVSAPKDENKDLWSISCDTIIPVLVKAIQEQQAQIDKQQTQIDELKKGIQAIMARNAP